MRNKWSTMGLLMPALLSALLMAAAARAQQVPSQQSEAQPLVKVWKTPSCGCCGKWVKHMQAAGFRVEVIDLDDVAPIKAANGVAPKLASCHTAVVEGYVVEGHVPASDVRRLLKEKRDILGLTAPGMPAGSPGMDVPGAPAFDVLSLGKDGATAVYATHGGKGTGP